MRYNQLIDKLILDNQITNYSVSSGSFKFLIDDNQHLFKLDDNIELINDNKTYHLGDLIISVEMNSNYPILFFINNRISKAKIEEGETCTYEIHEIKYI